MRDHVLLDDGAIVENFGDVMAGGADEFHTAFESLMMRFAADKRRQERMMDVDDVVRRILADKIPGQNLHVTRQND